MEDIALNLTKAIVVIAISIPFCILFFGGIALVVMQIKSMLNLDTNKKFTKDSQLSASLPQFFDRKNRRKAYKKKDGISHPLFTG